MNVTPDLILAATPSVRIPSGAMSVVVLQDTNSTPVSQSVFNQEGGVAVRLVPLVALPQETRDTVASVLGDTRV